MLRRILLLSATAVALLLPVSAATTWYETLDRARVRAQSSGKPILLLSMFGRLDQRWC